MVASVTYDVQDNLLIENWYSGDLDPWQKSCSEAFLSVSLPGSWCSVLFPTFQDPWAVNMGQSGGLE